MPTLTFDPSDDAPSNDQMAAEAAALAQGEKLQEAFQQDRSRKYEQTDQENSDVNLIGGKFKSQEDLLKAYNELQKKLGKGEDQDEPEEAPEGQEEAPEEAPEEEEQVAPKRLAKAAQEYAEKGELSDEAIEELSQMDSKDLIKAYVEFYKQNANQYQQQQSLQAAETQEIIKIAGGEKGYAEMVQWAADNLDQSEIDAYNNVTSSGNAAAVKFAVEALHNRYRAAEGYEAPLVSGKRSNTGTVKAYRSHAELARDIADPRYSSDPAFRADVEAKLARSKDLL